MADRRLFVEHGLSPRLTRLKGNFGVDASMDPSTSTGDARGVTVSKVSAGKYRVLWADEYLRLVHYSCAYSHDSSTTATFKKDARFGKVAEGSNYVEILVRSNDVALTNPSTGAVICWSLEFEDGNV